MKKDRKQGSEGKAGALSWARARIMSKIKERTVSDHSQKEIIRKKL